MSQNSIFIQNAPGAAVRTAINNALRAITELQSGSVEPDPTYPNMFWFDTSTNLLKRRNNANDAWVPMEFEKPSITNIVDTNSVTPDGSQRESEIYISALAQAFTLQNPTGVPSIGNTIVVQITAIGNDRNLTWGNGYTQLFGVLPAEILNNETVVIMFAYFNETWNVMNVLPAQEDE